jgi:hypothetical protein
VGIGYRSWQFWNALQASPAAQDLLQVGEFLPPELMSLFIKMQPSEQAHSIRIFHKLVDEGEDNQDLLVVALLHDVGKIKHPLNPVERALIVLGKMFLSERVDTWGQDEPVGWKAPFVVASQHADWGAQFAHEAGATQAAVSLIRRHQDNLPESQEDWQEDQETRLLRKLQYLDDEN